MFIQKRKYAKRIYADIIHSTSNCDGFNAKGILHPSISQQKQLYEQFYKMINIDPSSISYIEAHGTGTQVGDVVEGTSIAEFFCQGRETPLKLGSVKSNIGHTESVATLCGIAKLLVAFESGIIPPNEHFTSPNPNVKGLLNGQLQIEKNYQDEEYVALLHEIFSDDISGHLQRGHIILHENKDHVKSKTLFPGDKRPVWFVFTGMGSQ
ncbi:fatty acid synthase-like [Planococcus citri]|uniref:fatty acid synthase-like n=1 Tax=Planococcus citri TaxID=170843 RepID=UPI0031F78AFF